MTTEEHRTRDLELRDRNHQDWIRFAKSVRDVFVVAFILFIIWSLLALFLTAQF